MQAAEVLQARELLEPRVGHGRSAEVQPEELLGDRLQRLQLGIGRLGARHAEVDADEVRARGERTGHRAHLRELLDCLGVRRGDGRKIVLESDGRTDRAHDEERQAKRKLLHRDFPLNWIPD